MKLHIEADAFAEQRFDDLVLELGLRKIEAAGLLTLFWQGSQAREIITGSKVEIQSCLPVPRADRDRVFDVLVLVGYISAKSEGVYEVRGNRKHVGALLHYRELGSRGGKARAKQDGPPPEEAGDPPAEQGGERTGNQVGKRDASEVQAHAKRPANPDQISSDPISSDQFRSDPIVTQGSSSEVAGATPPPERQTEVNRVAWNAYIGAYRKRHGVDPTRNKTVNAQMANFVRRVGGADAPGIAAFYVNHNDFTYVKLQHPVSLLLRDAEGLRTQWLKGRAVTTQDAKQVEAKDRLRGQLERIEAGEI